MNEKILNEIMKECNINKKFTKLLIKICLDLKIDNYKNVIKDFINNKTI